MINPKTCQYIGPTNSRVGTCKCKTMSQLSSYCETHYSLVYQEGSGRATRHKDLRVADAVWSLQSELNEAIAELEAEGFL